MKPGILIYYSANPWIATDIAKKYREGKYFAWVCEYFDSEQAPPGSAGAMIAPSSNPKQICEELYKEWKSEEGHSSRIENYRKKFSELATLWLANKDISKDQYVEIIACIDRPSWKIWRPVLYVIPNSPTVKKRVRPVPRIDRAAYGPEHQIADLKWEEFDIIDLSEVRLR